MTKERKIEFSFLTVFSGLIVVIFYALISMNGLVLGNDPAVHLLKAQDFLKTGQIPLNNIGWVPPLFEILLAMTISFSGANGVGQQILIEKTFAVIIDWLLFISVYLVASKFLNKKIGALAAAFLSMCYPIYQLNTWGGYTTVLGIAFFVLLFYYSHLATKQLGYIVITFFLAFSIVLSHQLTAFLAVVILLPLMFLMLIKFRRDYLKGFVAIVIGGIIAFFAFYLPAIVNYFDTAISHLFFSNQAYVVDIPYTSYESFLLAFGFIQFLAVGGIGASYYLLKRQKNMILFISLMLSLFVPLFFAESYLFGFLLPFEWFMYYLAPPIAILAAVFTMVIGEKFTLLIKTNKGQYPKSRVKVAVCSIIVLISLAIFFQVDNTYGSVMNASDYNLTSDSKAYDAGVWLDQNYPDRASVVVTENPGDWFSVVSRKNVIAQTSGWYGTNEVAQSVLYLSYEMQTPQTQLRAYEANGNVTDENYVYLNELWYRVSYSSMAENSVSFYLNGLANNIPLSNLSREISFDQRARNTIEFRYFNDYIELMQTLTVQDSSYPVIVSWEIEPLKNEIYNVTLFLTTSFDLQFHFDKAQVSQVLSWANPWSATSKYTQGTDWAVVNFTSSGLTNNYVGLFDTEKQVVFAFNFTDIPQVGSIGALTNRQIDAVRVQYHFNQIQINQPVKIRYQTLVLTKDNFPTLQLNNLQALFDFKSDPYTVVTRDYKNLIAENKIEFAVYGKSQFNMQTSSPFGSAYLPGLNKCRFLELVYSNSTYDIFKILSNYNQTQVWNT